ncbi:hypothetical protein ACR79P_08445 [Sphingobacterium spiritivorum]|uniref:hypothetical protein n=2 Tax=Sphingobacterium spiritivorum TaxID=258 RepID=UPI003DA51468
MAKDKLSNDDKKEIAFDLFMSTDKTQNEICEIVGVAPKTFTRWKQNGLWDELKGATAITSHKIITNIYKAMHDMTLEGKDIKADALAKLARVVEVISDKKYTISQMFNVFKAFTNYVFPKDPETAKLINRYMKEFVDEQINK